MSTRCHKLSHFEASSLGKECCKTPCVVVVVVVVAQFLSYLRIFLGYSWSYIKINMFSRDKGKEWIIRERERERERERAPLMIQIFHDRESKSLITSFLSVCLRDSSSTDFFPLGRSIQLQKKWRSEYSLVSWSFFVSWVPSSSLSLSLSHTHTHTQRATPTLSLALLWALAVVRGWKTWMIMIKKHGW
jgi:hypothetical protein